MSKQTRHSILLSFYSVLFTLVLIEIVMRATVHMSAPRSTIIFQDWERTYWTPINTLGYRDVEPYSADLTNVLVVGDSFIAGYGVNRAEDRISGVLQTELGSAYGVNIVADIGWETPREFEALQTYPVAPDVVIWSHYANDLIWVYPEYPRVYPLPSTLANLSNNFYLTTYLYRTLMPSESGTIAEDSYQNADVVARHLALLQEVIDYCAEHNAVLIFVLWDVPLQRDTVPTIARLLDAQGVAYLDTTTFLYGREYYEVAASPLDAHPNVAVHAEVARLLVPMIEVARR